MPLPALFLVRCDVLTVLLNESQIFVFYAAIEFHNAQIDGEHAAPILAARVLT